MTARGMLTILFLVALLFAVSAQAADIAHARPEPGVTVVLTNERTGCPFDEGSMRIRLEVPNQKYLGCYTVVQGIVMIKWDDGDTGYIPTSLFSPAT
jgi:hypothetical protein